MPLRILSRPAVIRRFRVTSFIADVTQQIHSLRARGVISAHTFFTIGSDSIAFRKSAGNLCGAVISVFAIISVKVLHPDSVVILLANAALKEMTLRRLSAHPRGIGSFDSLADGLWEQLCAVAFQNDFMMMLDTRRLLIRSHSMSFSHLLLVTTTANGAELQSFTY